MSPSNKLVALPLAARGEGGTYFLPIAALPSRQRLGLDSDSSLKAKAGLRQLKAPVHAVTPDPSAGGPLSPVSDDSGFSLPDMVGGDEVEYPLPPGRKKRKTPAYQLTSGRQDEFAVYEGDVKDGTHRHKNLAPIIPGQTRARSDTDDEEGEGTATYSHAQDRTAGSAVEGDTSVDADTGNGTNLKMSRKLRPAATQTCEFRKLQFLRRKAALITLFLDATSAIKSYWTDEKSSSTNNISKNLLSKLPEVDVFEKLLPALEDVGVGGWPADKPTWRKGIDITDDCFPEELGEEGQRRLGVWRAKFAKRRKIKEERKEVVRGGWAPEGSFEFERSSKAGNVAREGAKARAALQRLANELRHILLTVKPKTATLTDQTPKTKTNTNKARTQTSQHASADVSGTAIAHPAASANATSAPADAARTGGDALERVGSGSKDGSEVGSGSGGKKKPKKKKRSVLANQSNPHHVDNYRSTRTSAAIGDPNEPYPHHASLLFPPSMSFLSARSNGSRIRASEEDYICSFCEYDLFYGSEKLRKAAIRRRKREIKRKENIKNKAKNVAEGKGKLNEESEYEEEGDDDEECEDQGYGKCSCGRALGPHGDKEHHLKPPDPDPNIASKSALPQPPPPSTTTTSTLPSDLNVPRLQQAEEVDVSRASTPSID